MLIRGDEMETCWQRTVTTKPTFKGKAKVDVAIVGAGMAGCLCAEFLQKAGKQVIVLEARQIGSGVSGYSSAKLTAQHHLIYHDLIQHYSLSYAKAYYQAQQEAIEIYEKLIDHYRIDCDFKRCNSYLYTQIDDFYLCKEAAAYQQIGIDYLFQPSEELPFSHIALGMKNQAHFDPVSFLSGLACHLPIYENSQVLKVEGNKLYLKEGEVSADQILFTTHYPFLDSIGFYFMKMYQQKSYILALKTEHPFSHQYLSIDDNTSLRSAYGKYLLIGGCGHRCGENQNGGQYLHLHEIAKNFSKEVICQWSTQDVMTLDGLPYVGKYSRMKLPYYVACGFNKWGMSNSMVASQLITALLTNQSHPLAKLLSPQRINLKNTFFNRLSLGNKSLIHYMKRFIPMSQLHHLPFNEAKIFEINHKKIGVYRDSMGDYHFVDALCPHLGCLLSFNPEQKCWDCPCHGSSFDIDGKLLYNPANKELPHQKKPNFSIKLDELEQP